MKPKTLKHARPGQGGYSMVELVVVVGLIVIMAAVAIPNIGGYIRNYRIRGATQQVAGMIQQARSKAIIKNVNQGVAFTIIDANTYRFYMPDDLLPPFPPGPPPTGLGPLQDLPQGVSFVAAANPGVGFERLGRACILGAPGCFTAPTLPQLCPTAGEMQRCTDRPPVLPGSNFVRLNGTDIEVIVQEDVTQQTRWVHIQPGGRVVTQP